MNPTRALAALGLALAACHDSSPTESSPRPARIDLTLAPHIVVAGDQIEARVFYRRTGAGGSEVTVGTQRVAPPTAEQQLSIPLDIGACLRDRRRESPGGTCVVDVALTLRSGAGETLATLLVPRLGLAPNDVYRVAGAVLLERKDGAPLLDATDPANDTLPTTLFGAGPGIDFRGVTVGAKKDSLIFVLRFGAPVRAASADAPNSLLGLVEIDIDENALTGETPFMNTYGARTPLGVEYALDLFDADPTAVPVLGIDGSLAFAPASFVGAVVTIRVPLEALRGDADFTFGGIVGTPDRPTDFFPNSGVYAVHRTAPGQLVRASGAGAPAPTPGRATAWGRPSGWRGATR